MTSPTLIDCTFSTNTASSRGGGIYMTGASEPLLRGCVVEGNSAPAGAGIYNGSSLAPALERCLLIANRGANGGGLYSAPTTVCKTR